MAYFKINDKDFSLCVNSLKVDKNPVYTSQTNAAGNTVVDFINAKRTVTVGVIPLSGEDMKTLQTEVDKFSVTISFINPITNAIEEGVACIIPSNSVEYYTIQADNILLNAFTLTFTEL